MSDELQNLSDINIHLHGFTQDDVIEGRHIRNEWIHQAATNGNRICLESERLFLEAKLMGIDVTYTEDLDDDDLL